MRNAFVAELTDLAKDPQVFSILADNGIIVFDEYRRQHPNQFLNVGIAECNMTGVAAGMASCGFIPFVYTIIPFLIYRPYEFIRNDICEQNLNVKLVGVGAGFAYSTLGPTHHATEDVSIMRCLPHMTVISPADPMETRKAVRAAYQHKGPVYLRIGTGKNPAVYQQDYDYVLGKGVVLKPGEDLTVIATGAIVHDVLMIAQELEKEALSIRVINMHTIKPLDEEIILSAAKETGAILTVEEHSVLGGLGSAVSEVISEKVPEDRMAFQRMGLNGFCSGFGSVNELREKNGLGKKDILLAIKSLHQRKSKIYA